MTHTERIRKLAWRFRLAIENCDKNELPISFESFPRGSCGDAAWLLGTYLMLNSVGSFDYMSGWRKECSHGWLQQGQIIVDITADQFPEIKEKIMVTTDHSWYSAFQGKAQHVADYRIFDEATVNFEAAYKYIVSHISES